MPAVEACFAHAARIAGEHCAAASALLPLLAEAIDMAWAEQPPSAGTAGVLATTVLLAVVASAFPDLCVSQASAAEAVQAQASRAGASSRSDFMDPTSRKVMAPRPLVRGARPTKLSRGSAGQRKSCHRPMRPVSGMCKKPPTEASAIAIDACRMEFHVGQLARRSRWAIADRKSTRLNSSH